jgi:alanine-glyoxylate transaminase/serine-glyoxylate transaminase/serine-pyruvate transaminase
MANEKLLLIPGPSPVLPRILETLALPTVSHVGPEMVRDLRDSCGNLRKIVFCEQGEPFIISGAGTLAMEMALLNTVGREDRALVVSQGYFGQRMEQICGAFGLRSDVLECEWGKAVLPEDLEARLSQDPFQVVVCTHVDTSTGACAPIDQYARIVKSAGALFVVDGVCATGGIPERMDDWTIDVVLTAAQKCLGTPPGLSLLVLSERAMAKRRSLGTVPAYYSDLLRWLPIMRDPAKYFSTPCVNEIRAFAEATRVIMEEGLESRFARHDLNARAIRAGLEALGFGFFTDPRFAASTLSVVSYPAEIEDKAFRAALYDNGVVVAGGLAQTFGRVFRMGHMGNLDRADVLFALEAVEETLRSLGHGSGPASGVGTARKILGA